MVYKSLFYLISVSCLVNLEWKTVESPQLCLKSNYTVFRYDIFDGPEILTFENSQELKSFYKDFLPYKGFTRIYAKGNINMCSELFYNGKICKSIKYDSMLLNMKLNVLFRSDDDIRKRIFRNILPNKKCLRCDYNKFKASSEAITMIMLNYHFMGKTRTEYLHHFVNSLQSIISVMFNVEKNVNINDIFNDEYDLFTGMLNDIILPYDILSDDEISFLNCLL